MAIKSVDPALKLEETSAMTIEVIGRTLSRYGDNVNLTEREVNRITNHATGLGLNPQSKEFQRAVATTTLAAMVKRDPNVLYNFAGDLQAKVDSGKLTTSQATNYFVGVCREAYPKAYVAANKDGSLKSFTESSTKNFGAAANEYATNFLLSSGGSKPVAKTEAGLSEDAKYSRKEAVADLTDDLSQRGIYLKGPELGNVLDAAMGQPKGISSAKLRKELLITAFSEYAKRGTEEYAKIAKFMNSQKNQVTAQEMLARITENLTPVAPLAQADVGKKKAKV
ncbi:MAG: hypothetical protein Q7S22_02335 [Candidatus Micrarchaeota archaeon]|nr:hypothetical protein [Candidatus Micrarchaeota archaeon]